MLFIPVAIGTCKEALGTSAWEAIMPDITVAKSISITYKTLIFFRLAFCPAGEV